MIWHEKILLPTLLVCAWVSTQECYASEEKPSTTAGRTEKASEESDSFLPDIEELFENQQVLRTIDQGAEAINRSIDSLMETVFYSLLDQRIIRKLSEYASARLEFERKLFSSKTGNHVVIDTVKAGPQYERKIADVAQLPLAIRAGISGDIYFVYPTSDAQRLIDGQTKPYWENLIDNWFGILPALTYLLPPSFNPMEMYRPTAILEVPFSFPSTPQMALEMPENTICSYSVNGIASLPLDFAAEKVKDLFQEFAKNEIALSFPLSVFVRKDFRINIIRKAGTTFWVGVSFEDAQGAALVAYFSQISRIMAGTIAGLNYAGVPLGFTPIDTSFISETSKKRLRIFAFDLSNPLSHSSFMSAISGRINEIDNTLKAKEPHFDEVSQILTENERTSEKHSNKLFLLFSQSNNHNINRKIEKTRMNDESFTSFRTETTHSYDSNNIYTGPRKLAFRSRANIPVVEDPLATQKTPEGEPVIKYTFANPKEPYSLTFRLEINDHYTNTEDFNQYAELLRKFSNLPLEDLPQFNAITTARPRSNSGDNPLFLAPDRFPLATKETSIPLGKLTVNASIELPFKDLQIVRNLKPEAVLQVILEEYGISLEEYNDFRESRVLKSGLQILKLTTFPLKMLGVPLPALSSAEEAEEMFNALICLRSADTPEALRTCLVELVDTSHPLKRVLIGHRLLAERRLPTSISFYTQPPKTKSESPYQAKFLALNKRTIRSGVELQPTPDDLSQQIKKSFSPMNLLRDAKGIQIAACSLKPLQKTKTPSETKPLIPAEVVIELEPSDRQADKILFSIEKKSAIRIGSFTIREQVIPLTPSMIESLDGGGLRIRFQPEEEQDTFGLSELQSFILKHGGVFSIGVAIIDQHNTWGPLCSTEFVIENDRVRPKKNSKK